MNSISGRAAETLTPVQSLQAEEDEVSGDAQRMKSNSPSASNRAEGGGGREGGRMETEKKG